MFAKRYFPGRYYAPRYWPGVGADAVGPTQPGLEYRLSSDRLHFAVPQDRLHYRVESTRLHYQAKE